MTTTARPTDDGPATAAKVDARARALLSSNAPRVDLADAIDWLNGEWSMEGQARPCIVIADHLATLCRAASERERELGQWKREPVGEKWTP